MQLAGQKAERWQNISLLGHREQPNTDEQKPWLKTSKANQPFTSSRFNSSGDKENSIRSSSVISGLSARRIRLSTSSR